MHGSCAAGVEDGQAWRVLRFECKGLILDVLLDLFGGNHHAFALLDLSRHRWVCSYREDHVPRAGHVIRLASLGSGRSSTLHESVTSCPCQFDLAVQVEGKAIDRRVLGRIVQGMLQYLLAVGLVLGRGRSNCKRNRSLLQHQRFLIRRQRDQDVFITFRKWWKWRKFNTWCKLHSIEPGLVPGLSHDPCG